MVPLQLLELAKAHSALQEWTDALSLVAQALGMMDDTGERICESVGRRLRATLSLAGNHGGTLEAQTDLLEAIEVARCQGARWLEIRAACDLARLWGETGDRHKALDLLAPTYDQFTEGFNTSYLKDAKALLDELA